MKTKDLETQRKDTFKRAATSKLRSPYWKPILENFLVVSEQKINIDDLEKTLPAFNKALEHIAYMAINDKTILFVGTKFPVGKIVSHQARRCNQPYVSHLWIGGMLTNYKTIRRAIEMLLDLELERDSGVFDRLSKKEALVRTRHLERLQHSLGGIKNMRGLPDALFVIDINYDQLAVKEANKLGIPVIGIVNPNDNPHGVDEVIPVSNDSLLAIKLYVKAVADVINANSVRENKAELETHEIEFLKMLGEDLKIANARAEKAIVGAQKELELTLEFLKSRKKEMQKG